MLFQQVYSMNLSILIHTFNQYEFLWKDCLSHWERIPRESCDYYFGTDTEEHSTKDFGRFKVIYSGVGAWSDRLTSMLHKIPTKYLLYLQEDHWPVKNHPELPFLMEMVEKYDLKRLQISPINQFYSLVGDVLPLFFHYKSKYLVSHQPSIWEKSFLLEQIRYNEDPWINEYEGTKRLNYPQIQGKIAIYPHKWYHHACENGKLIPIREI